MTTDIYTATDTSVTYAEDTAWGTAGVPTGVDYIDRVTSINCTIKNNRTRYNNLGTGPNAAVVTNGTVDISGSITAQLTNAEFFQYLVGGVVVANAGTQADPSDVNEVDGFGYSATTVPSITVWFGNNGTVDDVMKLDGLTFNNWTVSAKVGEPVTWTADYKARNLNRASSGALTYTAPTKKPFTFADGTVSIGSDTVAKVESIELTGNNNYNYYYSIGSRLLSQPTFGTRRYDFTMTIKHSDDTTASTLSGTEIRELLFGAAGSTTPETGGIPTACGDLVVTLTEGTASGDNLIEFQFDDCYIEEISEPIEMGDNGGPIMLTVSGFALSGLTNGSDKTVIEYGTHA